MAGETIFKGMNKSEFDVVVIGGGSGGYAAARTVAGAGKHAAVIEGAREMGGLCILRGCMPTKALLYAAEIRHLASEAGTWGISTGKVGHDFKKVMARKNAQIRDFAGYRQRQLEKGAFQLIRDSARFCGPQTLELSSGKKIKARHVVVATGSIVAPPPIPSLKETGYWTSDDAINLKTLPKSLLILGGGAIACEFAQFFARFGVKVTLLQRSEHVLKSFDTEASIVVEDVFRKEGIEVFTQTRLLEASRGPWGKRVTFMASGKKITRKADEILFALGRKPATDHLNLKAAGVKTDAQGRILTNSMMRTSCPTIFAAGDCTSPHEIVHLAVAQGEVAGHNILNPGQPRRMDYKLLISVAFTDPTAAMVGMTEKEARSAGIDCISAQYPFDDHGKSLLMEAKSGFVKLIANARTGKIIGGACVGPQGGELIHEIVVAMAGGLTVHQLAATPHYHPTLAEIWTYPAEELAARIPK